MPILDYNDAEVNPKIRRILPTELCLERRLEGERYRGNHNDGIYTGRFGSEEVIVKVFSRSPGFNRVEINTLFELQGVTATPVLLGYVKRGAITIKTTPDVPIKIKGASVMKRAWGEPLMSVTTYTEPNQGNTYYALTRINLHAEVARQIAAYHRGCLERGYIDVDIPERDILLFIEGREVQVTKVDQDMVYNRRDSGFYSIEIVPNKYNSAMKYLFLLVPKINTEGTPLVAYTSTEEEDALRWSTYYQQQGLSLLPDLLRAFAEHEFDTDTFPAYRKFPDDNTFLRFLDRWEKAMEEYGRWVIESAPSR